MQKLTSSPWVDVALSERILTLTINRPERFNAIGPSLASQLLINVNLIRKELRHKTSTDIRAIVMRAQPRADRRSRRIWIAGGDLQELQHLDARQAAKYADTMRRICRSFEQLPVPVISVVEGLAIGGGAELALSGDLRLGSIDAGMQWKQLRMGLTTGYNGTERLVRLCGIAKAQQWLYSGREIDANEMFTAGLLTHPPFADLEKDLKDIVNEIVDLGPEVFAAQKKLFGGAKEAPLFRSLWKSHQHLAQVQKYLSSHRA